ncbi:MAG: HlyD family efflux transporter periplasmic adaptor subunit [Acidaminococcaceae bacterium]
MLGNKEIKEDRSEHERPSKVLWVLVAAFFAILVWSYFYRIDQVVRGSGTFIATSRVQVIQAVDGGMITSLKVKEGDRVAQGQVLATLDDGRSLAAVRELDGRLAALYAKAARLKAEIAGDNSVKFPSAVEKFPEIIKVETALFNQRTSGFQEDMRTAAVAVSLAREDAQLVANLASNGDVSRSDVIRAQKAVNEAEAMMINRRNKYLQEVGTDLTKAEDEIGQNEQVRAQRMQQLENTVLKASVPGIVKNMRLTTAGSVLRAGEELMQIVPVDDDIIVEVKVRPTDIAQLRPGLPANIRVDPYDYTIYGAVAGKVSYVSADTLKEDTRAGEQVYYRVHVTTKGAPVVTQTGKEIEILPGMTSQVDIRIGDRTVLEYLLETVAQNFNRIFRRTLISYILLPK